MMNIVYFYDNFLKFYEKVPFLLEPCRVFFFEIFTLKPLVMFFSCNHSQDISDKL